MLKEVVTKLIAPHPTKLILHLTALTSRNCVVLFVFLFVWLVGYVGFFFLFCRFFWGVGGWGGGACSFLCLFDWLVHWLFVVVGGGYVLVLFLEVAWLFVCIIVYLLFVCLFICLEVLGCCTCFLLVCWFRFVLFCFALFLWGFFFFFFFWFVCFLGFFTCLFVCF